jgi:hypothetical protein
MNSEQARLTAPSRDIRGILSWIVGVSGSVAMLHYEYRWAQLCLHSSSAISLSRWFGVSISIAGPWCWLISALAVLTKAARDRKLSRDILVTVSMLLTLAIVTIYGAFALEIHHVMSFLK